MENIYKEQAQHKLSNYKSLGELMWITIKSHEDKIAQLDACTEETVTYAELQNKVVRCALWLQKKGIKSGDVISICTGNHLNSIVPCLSTTYINAIFNPWNENMDLQTALYFLQLMMPKMIFCSEKSVNIILSAIKKQNYNATVVVFGKHVDAVSFSDILKNCNDVEVTNFRYIELDNIKKTACIMHSSGTTGIPKGVELSNYAMLFISLQYEINLTNVPSLWFSTIYWITGVIMSFSGIIQNTKAIIYPEFDEEMTCRLIQKYKIETVFLSTNMMNRLHQSNCIQKYPLSFLKTVMFGGTSIRPKVQEELEHLLPHVQILQCYGMTELGIITMQLPNHKNGSCGTIVKTGQIKVVDPETGKVLNPNQSGEIWLKLPSIMNGYYKNPEATKNTIDKDEIENVLISHPAVSEVVVIGIPHAIDDEHPLAFIIKQPGAKVMEQELIDFVANNMMDDCKLRGGVIFLSKFPYTSSGKILKKELKDVQTILRHENCIKLINQIKNIFVHTKLLNAYIFVLYIFTMENSICKGQIKHNLNNYKSLGELIWITIKSNGDKIARLDARTEETVTYAEMQNKAVRCALWLQKQGIKSGDVISVCTGNHLNTFVPCLSAAYINAIFNPWNENMSLQTTLYFLQLTMPKMIFCSEKSINVILNAIKKQNCNPMIVIFGKHVDAVSFSDILKNCNDAEITNFHYICMSNYTMLILMQHHWIHITNVSSLWFSPLFWLSGIMMNLNGIMQSTKAIIYPEFDEEMTCRLIEKYKVQVLFLGTNLLNRFLRSEYIQKYPLSSLKVIKCGGSLLKSKVQENLRHVLPHVQILQCYGMTETGGVITIQQPHHKNGSCGVLIENVKIKIVDPESGKVLGSNQSGEVWIKVPSLMNGYYRNPEATKNIIDNEGWLHSGDIGYVDEDGELFIIDRIKELIKYKGYHISPGEIENILLSHPAVLEAAIIGVPHILDDEHPLAYINKRPGVKVTEQELIDFVAKNMEDRYKLRGGVIFLDSFPCTDSGKISKKDLKAMARKLAQQN
ncbi:LUCI monooxygenase, partial [Acromyrmex insinuator]